MIHVTSNGGYWLSCFADDPDSEFGDPITPIDPGDNWDEMAAKVAAHRAEHRCAPS